MGSGVCFFQTKNMEYVVETGKDFFQPQWAKAVADLCKVMKYCQTSVVVIQIFLLCDNSMQCSKLVAGQWEFLGQVQLWVW